MPADPIAQQLGSRGWEPYTATCQQCGREFLAKRRIGGGGRGPVLYCGGSCRTKAWQARKLAAKPISKPIDNSATVE